MSLPECFCWTRFGTEAGQSVEHIFARKERERASNSGVFFWGIGNAIGPSIRELLRVESDPAVIFSAIKSTPRAYDVYPPAVAVWTIGETLNGDQYRLPRHSVVTSRYDPTSPKTVHYALVCSSNRLIIDQTCMEEIAFSDLRNVIKGTMVGASQVTAVVRRQNVKRSSAYKYGVAIRARLVYPYFVRLRHPVILPRDVSLDTSDSAWIDTVLRFARESASCSNVDESPSQAVLAL